MIGVCGDMLEGCHSYIGDRAQAVCGAKGFGLKLCLGFCRSYRSVDRWLSFEKPFLQD